MAKKKAAAAPAGKCWLMKSDAESYDIDALARDGRTSWDGVRNYQARNFMRDAMKVGDEVLFYHSNSNPSGVAGLARICGPARPDETAWTAGDHHFDPKSSAENPTWLLVDIEFVAKFPKFVSLETLKAEPKLAELMVIQKGSRLSIQPVDKSHFEIIRRLGSRK